MHLADAFIQSDLQCIPAIHLYCQYILTVKDRENLVRLENLPLYFKVEFNGH